MCEGSVLLVKNQYVRKRIELMLADKDHEQVCAHYDDMYYYVNPRSAIWANIWKRRAKMYWSYKKRIESEDDLHASNNSK